MIDRARCEIKLGDYAVGPATALEDTMLLPRVQAYRRQLGSRMIALDRDSCARKLPAGDYLISKKVDGEFTVLVFDGEQALTLNPGGTVRTGLPFMVEAAELLKRAGIKSALVVGELHVVRADGKRSRVHDVSRVVRKPELEVDLQSIQFAVFDIIDVDGSETGGDFSAVWERIVSIFSEGKLVGPVDAVQGKDSKDVLARFAEWVDDEGEEGVVARSDASGIFKVKPRHTIDLAVIGFAEGTDDRAGMLHDMLLAMIRPDGAFHVIGRVGGGFTDEDRGNLLSDLQDMVVESEYAEVNSDRVAYQMVEPKWVAEISCLDFVAETTRGGTIDRMVLDWNAEESRWETVRRLPLVSIISPQFVRLRDDKNATPDDVRIAQLTDLVEIPLSDKTAQDLALPKGEVLRREVVTKVLKGATMVRKLLMWKTNKEDISDEFPAYVVHLTDFSPNRKDPMKREIRVSSSREQIDQLWDALREKFFVKGWKAPE